MILWNSYTEKVIFALYPLSASCFICIYVTIGGDAINIWLVTTGRKVSLCPVMSF